MTNVDLSSLSFQAFERLSVQKRQPVQDAKTCTLFKNQVACSREREMLRENSDVGDREGRSIEPVSIVLHTPFQHTSS